MLFCTADTVVVQPGSNGAVDLLSNGLPLPLVGRGLGVGVKVSIKHGIIGQACFLSEPQQGFPASANSLALRFCHA